MKNDLKCGEIFRYGPDNFIFSCAYCNEQFDSHLAALGHIESHFLAANTDVKPKAESIESNEPSILDQTYNPMSAVYNEDCQVNIKEELLINIEFEPIIELPISVNTFPGSNIVTSNPERERFDGNSAIIRNATIDCDICGVTLQTNDTNRHFKLKHKIENIGQDGSFGKDDSCFSIFKENFRKSPDSTNRIEKKIKEIEDIKPNYTRRLPKVFWGPKYDRVECDVCGNKMKSNHIHRHLESHVNKMKFKCTICTRCYSTLPRLKQHIKTHSLVKKYTCHVCGWQFHSNGNLKVHIRTHTGEKPYKCTYCPMSFIHSTALVVHTRTHTGEKPFKCSLCDKSFSRQNLRKVHMRRHMDDKPYKCSYCGRSFVEKGSLDYHERSQHTGERPFKCDVCERTFARNKNLKQHYSLHTGVKSFQCRLCDLAFVQCAQRRKHERCAHQDVAYSVCYE